ncbi:MAG: lysylphosphatidylglycerol synthase transmembrane domain-containing protein [Thermodesulfobacteriota bacterium]
MIKNIIRISISCLLLVYFSFKVNWQVIRAAFLEIDIFYYVVSTIIATSGGCFIAWKYHLLLRGTPLSLSVRRLMVIQSISRFYALFLPSALGPEAVRWYKVTKAKKGKSFFFAATVYERLLFLLALLGAGMVPLFFYTRHPGLILLRNRILPVVLCCTALMIVALLYLLLPPFHESVKRLLKKLLRVQAGGRMDLLLENLALKDRSAALFIRLLFLTLCWQAVFVLRIYFLFAAMDLGFRVGEAAWMGSLVMLLQVLPISFAGLGVRDGAYAYLFALYGAAPEKGVLIGILFFTQMLVFSLSGAIFNLFEK